MRNVWAMCIQDYINIPCKNGKTLFVRNKIIFGMYMKEYLKGHGSGQCYVCIKERLRVQHTGYLLDTSYMILGLLLDGILSQILHQVVIHPTIMN